MNLGRKLEMSFKAYGKTLKLELSFDTVLRMYDLQQSDEADEDKVDVSLRLLVKNYRAIQKWPLAIKAQTLNEIFGKFIITDKKAPKDEMKTVDFLQDAKYIYASFMTDYGIDLYEQQGKLDWRKFIALFGGLSAKTKIRDVIAIRAMEIPNPNEDPKVARAKQIQELQKAKAYYALEISAEESEQNVQKGLAQLFGTLSAQAKAGENGVRR